MILWQSAKPVLDAHPIKLPATLDNHYIVAVTGIPPQIINAAMLGGRGGGRGGSGRFGGGRQSGGDREGGGRPEGASADGLPSPASQALGGDRSAPGGERPAGPPAPPGDLTAGLKRGTTLIVKGKAPQNADVVMSMNNNATLLFGFTKDVLALAVTDKEVDFEVKLGALSAKAKFNLKDMMYHEELAL